ncbi:Protein of unknown function [Pseudoduganella namucuonensis]|uniref:Type VI lipase adapter protein Tla3 C-terminal domain-containing protein n=2 Tax=Pseudoduganella namucuonensis TaxID=1035707 RepID=A0A1I7FWR2_9BURK|nr:Protein of unknown function [Pseudoduganella namucuonensis]
MMYYQLKRTVPYPPRERWPEQHLERYPTVAEWEAASASFAKRSDIRDGWGTYKLTSKWKPTPWFPVPWSHEQLAAFDRLPTLGYLHRPVFVKMINDRGEPLTRRADREAALQKGWQQAALAVPKEARNTLPSRVIVGADNNTDQLVMFHSLLRQITAEGGPEFDPNKHLQFIDTDRRLNNTGAATFFMQIAIGVLGSYREGGISAAFNLRDPNEASIILVSPAPDDKRTSQRHPAGGDVFRHKVEPLDDPRVYEQK